MLSRKKRKKNDDYRKAEEDRTDSSLLGARCFTVHPGKGDPVLNFLYCLADNGGAGEDNGVDKDTAKLLQFISEVKPPATQSTPMPGIEDNVWRNVFEPSSDLFSKAIGGEITLNAGTETGEL